MYHYNITYLIDASIQFFLKQKKFKYLKDRVTCSFCSEVDVQVQLPIAAGQSIK
jgi:hypothetical protein